MLIRVNKTLKLVDNSLLIPQIIGFENIQLSSGWEWVDINSEWYQAYELEKINLENELRNIEIELKLETHDLQPEEAIRYLTEKVISQEKIIDNLIIEVLNV